MSDSKMQKNDRERKGKMGENVSLRYQKWLTDFRNFALCNYWSFGFVKASFFSIHFFLSSSHDTLILLVPFTFDLNEPHRRPAFFLSTFY